jgi:hypothetical protein
MPTPAPPCCQFQSFAWNTSNIAWRTPMKVARSKKHEPDASLLEQAVTVDEVRP